MYARIKTGENRAFALAVIGWVDCQVRVHTHAYVCLREYIRNVLDLNPDPDSPLIPIGSWTSSAS